MGFKSKGHAGFADSGYDIICAGVSALVINFINSAEELCHAEYSLDTDEETGMIDYRLEGGVRHVEYEPSVFCS